MVAFSKISFALEKRSGFSAFKYRAAIRQYSGSISTPMLFRPVLRAAIIVVPVPQNGSSTVSPVKENMRTRRVASSIGNGAGCCLVDAPGIFQICWKPLSELFLGYLACFALCFRGLPISPRLALHEDEFHVVLDDGVGFIRLAQKLRPVRHFIGGIGDFVPDDGVQIVKANPSADDTNVGMEGENEVSAKIASGHADIADHAHQPPTGDKDTKSMPPNLFQLTQKCLVILDMPKLIRILLVPFEIPVWGEKLRRGGGIHHPRRTNPVHRH